MKKRLLSILLAFSMVLTFLPAGAVTAFALDQNQDTTNMTIPIGDDGWPIGSNSGADNVQKTEYLYYANWSYDASTKTLTLGGSINSFNFNQKSIKCNVCIEAPESGFSSVEVSNAIFDGFVENHGKIINSSFNGDVTNYGSIYAYNKLKPTVSANSTITNKSGAYIGCPPRSGSNSINQYLAISGKIINEVNGTIQYAYCQSGSTIENAGTIQGGFFMNGSEIINTGTISGGIFDGTVTNNGSITGGVFTTKPTGIVGSIHKVSIYDGTTFNIGEWKGALGGNVVLEESLYCSGGPYSSVYVVDHANFILQTTGNRVLYNYNQKSFRTRTYAVSQDFGTDDGGFNRAATYLASAHGTYSGFYFHGEGSLPEGDFVLNTPYDIHLPDGFYATKEGSDAHITSADYKDTIILHSTKPENYSWSSTSYGFNAVANGDGTYSFTMPDKPITLTATRDKVKINIPDGVKAEVKNGSDYTDATIETDETTELARKYIEAEPDTTIRLTVTDPQESKSYHWSNETGTTANGTSYEFTVSDNITIGLEIVDKTPEIPAGDTKSTTLTNAVLKKVMSDGHDITNSITKNADGSYDIPIGAKVTVAFDKDAFADSGSKFSYWKNTGLTQDEANLYNKQESFTFTMPDRTVTLEAMTQDESIDDTTAEILGTAAIIGTAVVGGAILAYQGHQLGTELYLTYLLPSGAVIPTNRIQLAMLLWQDAGNPVPVDEPAYSDIDADDTDTLQAAQWAVETGLMELPDADNAPDQFDPYAAVSTVEVIHAWKNAQKVKQG